MTYSVYIRPLNIEDAQTSYKWRNNPTIWKYTEFKPEGLSTPEKETQLLAIALQRNNEKRFAICLVSADLYIGNISLTNIKDSEAEIHFFIGEIEFQGKGKAYEANCQMLAYGFEQLKLTTIHARCNKENSASANLLRRLGFRLVSEYNEVSKGVIVLNWIFSRDMYDTKEHLSHGIKLTSYTQQ